MPTPEEVKKAKAIEEAKKLADKQAETNNKVTAKEVETDSKEEVNEAKKAPDPNRQATWTEIMNTQRGLRPDGKPRVK